MNINKLYSIIYLFFLYIGNLSAQEFIVKGSIVDRNSTPIEFISAILLKNDSTILQSSTTDSLGIFSIKIHSGSYILVFKQFSQELIRKDIQLFQDLDLGKIEVDESIMLKEVVVQARQKLIERKVDRVVFNVENSISASGGDAIDALKITPGLKVQNNSIIMIGKSSMAVMINERLMQLSGDELIYFLKSINSEDIKRIEVISNPSSKYNAEGNSGLINIVLKKAKRNYFGGNIRGSYQQTTHPKGLLGGDINYQKDKLSTFATIVTGNGSIGRSENMKVSYPSQLWDTESNQEIFSKLISTRVGVDYEISKNNIIGIQYLGSNNRPDIEEDINTNIYNQSSNNLDSTIITNSYTDKKNYYHSLNGHYKLILDSIGREINVDVDYLKYNDNLSRVNNSKRYAPKYIIYDDAYKNTSGQNIEAFTSAVDLQYPTSFADLTFGGKVSFLENNSRTQNLYLSNNEFIVNEHESDYFKYNENIQAAYFNIKKTLGKWDFQTGLRVEVTQAKSVSISLDQANTNNYIKPFPTVYVVFSPNEDHSYSFNYGRRISRPNYERLNPFKWYSSPYSFSVGNPFLKPSYTDNLELSYTLKNNFNLTTYFSKTTDGARQITLIDSLSNIQSTVWDNFIDDYSIGITSTYTLEYFKWLNSSIQANAYYLNVKSTNPNTIASQSGINFNFSINNSFYLNRKRNFTGELNYWYEAPGVSAIYHFSSSSSLDIALRLSLLNKKLNLSLVMMDILKTNISTVSGLTNNIPIQYRNYYDSRQIRISVAYKFGNDKLKNKQKKFSNEEERKRLD